MHILFAKNQKYYTENNSMISSLISKNLLESTETELNIDPCLLVRTCHETLSALKTKIEKSL